MMTLTKCAVISVQENRPTEIPGSPRSDQVTKKGRENDQEAQAGFRQRHQIFADAPEASGSFFNRFTCLNFFSHD